MRSSSYSFGLSLDTRPLLPARREGDDIGGMQRAPTVDPREIPEPRLSSESFDDGGVIPDSLAAEDGISPQLAWANVPRGTARFVVIIDDPDATAAVGRTFVHWVAALPERVRSLDEGASGGGWTDNPVRSRAMAPAPPTAGRARRREPIATL